MIWFWDNYMPKDEHRNDIYASPLKATAEQLKGLPPTLVQTAENDVLCDEGDRLCTQNGCGGCECNTCKNTGNDT